ncbi:hypothetical protein D3C79_778880 [compost metagenome]
MHLLGNVVQLVEKTVTHRPQLDGLFQVTDLAKVQVQPDDTGDVVRMVATLKNAPTCCLKVRIWQIQSSPQLMATLRHRKGLLVLVVVSLVVAVGIQVEVVDRVFLPLGPEALPRHVTTHRR